MRRAGLWIGGALLVALAPASFALAADSGAPDGVTTGPLPASAFTATGTAAADLPDYVPALDRDGSRVGYVERARLMPADGSAPSDEPLPVYAADLTTQVGAMYPGRGYVPLGTDPASVPPIAVTAPGADTVPVGGDPTDG